jgi:hypothetical protein
MGIVEGEPDHIGLSAWGQVLRRLQRRWQRPRRKRDPERDRMAPIPDPTRPKGLFRGRNTS